MKKIFLILIFIIYSINIFSCFNWKAYKDDTFIIFFKKENKKDALRILSGLKKNKNIPEKIIGRKIKNVPIILEDYGLLSILGGYTNPIYYKISLTINNSFFEHEIPIAIHEYTHLLHLTYATDIPYILTFLSGNIFSPNLFSPEWLIEGITTYTENKINKYTGSLNTGLFDAYLASFLKEKKNLSILKATYNPLEFPGGYGYYIYGGEFFNFLSQKYREEKFSKFFKSYSKSIFSYLSPIMPFLGIDNTFREVYDKSTEILWDKWVNYEKERLKNYKIKGKRISKNGWYNKQPVIYKDKLYFLSTEINKISSFRSYAIHKIKSYDLKSKKIKDFFTTTASIIGKIRFYNDKAYFLLVDTKKGYNNKTQLTYGTYTLLYEINLNTKKQREILKGNIRSFFIDNDGNIIFVEDKKNDFGSKIYKYNIKTKTKEKIYEGDIFINEINGYNSNIIFSGKYKDENLSIYELKDKKIIPLIKSNYIEEYPFIVNNKIFFNANYNKKFSIYMYDIKTKKTYKVSNSYFAIQPLFYEDKIYYVSLNSEGYNIYVEDINIKNLKKIEIPDLKPLKKIKILKEEKIKKGSYIDNLLTLYPKVRIPLIYFDSNFTNYKAGLLFNSSDAIGDFNYLTLFMYDIKNKKFIHQENLTSFLFAPLVIYGGFSNFEEDSYYIGADYLFLNKKLPGINMLAGGILYSCFDNLKRKQIIPSIRIGFSYPYLNLRLNVRTFLEGSYTGSMNGKKENIYIDFNFEKIFCESSLKLNIKNIYDPYYNEDETVFPVIKGYDKGINGVKGSVFNLSYNHKLFSIRDGLWNPFNIYFEDVFAGGFFNYSLSDIENNYSYGVSLNTELKLFFSFMLDIEFYAGLNKENKIFSGVYIKTPLVSF